MLFSMENEYIFLNWYVYYDMISKQFFKTRCLPEDWVSYK